MYHQNIKIDRKIADKILIGMGFDKAVSRLHNKYKSGLAPSDVMSETIANQIGTVAFETFLLHYIKAQNIESERLFEQKLNEAMYHANEILRLVERAKNEK